MMMTEAYEEMVFREGYRRGYEKGKADRPKGEWKATDAYPHNVYCSVCYKTFAQQHWEVWEDGTLPRNFCPNCGADMRGEDNEAD